MHEVNGNPVSRAMHSIEAMHFAVVEAPERPVWLEELNEAGAARAVPVAEQAAAPRRNQGGSTAEKSDAENGNPFELGRAQGRLEILHTERQEREAVLQALRREHAQQSARLVEQLAIERDRYLSAVEHEVVKLALAIATRVLRREPQMDPLFLTGAVRVALGQLAENTKVRLRVPAADAELWAETMLHLPNLKLRPTVVSDEHLETGDCVIETDLGSADLGLRAQIEEIESRLLKLPESQRRSPSEERIGV